MHACVCRLTVANLSWGFLRQTLWRLPPLPQPGKAARLKSKRQDPSPNSLLGQTSSQVKFYLISFEPSAVCSELPELRLACVRCRIRLDGPLSPFFCSALCASKHHAVQISMNALSTYSTERSVCNFGLACARLSSRKARKFAPFVSATANAHQHPSAAATDPSKRRALQQIALAATALSLGTAVDLSTPAASDAYLVQFPVADLRNQYFLVCNNMLCICPSSLQQTSLSHDKTDTPAPTHRRL